jgi:hypothetical protein
VIRSALAFSAGLLREIGEVVVPLAVRRGQLYRSLVDVTLRYVIEWSAALRECTPPKHRHCASTAAFTSGVRRPVGQVPTFESRVQISQNRTFARPI